MSKTNKKTREEILSAKRKASKLRYDKIKSDPELSQRRKEKDKENYLKKKKNKQVTAIRMKSVKEQKKQREKWRQNSKAYYLRKKEQKEIQSVYINENKDEDKPLAEAETFEMDPLEPSCSNNVMSHSLPNDRKQEITILSDVKVNYDLKKLFRSRTTNEGWKYNCSSLDITKDFKEFRN